MIDISITKTARAELLKVMEIYGPKIHPSD